MIASTEYPKLGNFVGCAFHQDWDDTADTYQGVVDANVAIYPRVSLDPIETEIAALLASPATNEELAEWLTVIGCCAILDGEGYTPRSFITMIGDRIRARGQ